MSSWSRLMRCGFGLGLGIVIVILALFNTLLIWVATGPRVLDEYTPYIEQSLSSIDGSYHVKIGQTVLIWDGWRNPIDIKLRDVEVRNQAGAVFSEFPDVSLGIDLPSLLFGNVRPASLTIRKPTIRLHQQADYSIGIGYPAAEPVEEDNTATIAPESVIYSLFYDQQGNFSRMRHLRILDATIRITNPKWQEFFTARNAELSFTKNNQDIIDIKTVSHIRYGSRDTRISGVMQLPGNVKIIEGGFKFDEVILAELEQLFTGGKDLEKFTMPIGGTIQFSLDTIQRKIMQLGFQIAAGQGQFEHTSLGGAIRFDNMEVRGELVDDLNKIKIQQLSGDLNGMQIRVSGEASLQTPFSIQGMAELEHADASDVQLLWPPELAPVSRAWVLDNITPADIPLARVAVNIKPGDLDLPVLPREAIDSEIHIKNATIKYLPEHPPVSRLIATIKIDSVGLAAAVESAQFLKDTTLSNGEVLIPDLNADNPRITVSLNSNGSASDAVKLLELPRLEHAKRLGLSQAMQGKVSAKATVGFDFYAPRDTQGNLLADDNISYDITTQLEDISQSGLMQRFNLSKCSGTMHVENGSLTFQGSGTVNGASVKSADVRYLFTPQDGLDTFVKLDVRAPVASLPQLGYPKPEFLDGSIAGMAEMEQGPDRQTVTANINLTDTDIMDNALRWIKPAGTPASLDIQTFKQDGKLTIPSFHLKGPGADISGLISLNDALTDITTLELTSSSFGPNKIQKLHYAKDPESFVLDVQASHMDLSQHLKANKEGGGFSFQDFPAAQLNASIKTLVLDENAPVIDFKAAMKCSTMRCESAEVKGKTNDVPFEFRILRNPNGKRQLSFHGANAGLFLKAMGIYDGMQDGLLTISGNFDDEGETRSQLAGRLVIGNFVLNDAPVLAKILSLASFTGFIDTLQGNGIAFKQMSVPFTLENDVITLKDAKAAGPAMGITVDGTITMPHVVLDLSGTVVPSYTVNSGVGQVPIVGPLLTGGKDQGVFAARYSVKDSYKDPQVSVNPLSILAPGFLRNLFDIFEDTDKKKSEKVYPGDPSVP